MSDNNKTRITLDLKSSLFQKLSQLEETLEAESKAGVLREALVLYSYLASRISDGATIQVVKPDGEKETLVILRTYST